MILIFQHGAHSRKVIFNEALQKHLKYLKVPLSRDFCGGGGGWGWGGGGGVGGGGGGGVWIFQVPKVVVRSAEEYVEFLTISISKTKPFSVFVRRYNLCMM